MCVLTKARLVFSMIQTLSGGGGTLLYKGVLRNLQRGAQDAPVGYHHGLHARSSTPLSDTCSAPVRYRLSLFLIPGSPGPRLPF